jgi:RNA polymerase sigma-70 factor (ECF subfamily)
MAASPVQGWPEDRSDARARVHDSASPDAPDGDERRAAIERDAALIDRVRAGDRAAFDPLVQTYMRHAFRMAYRVVGHREDAEDLVQESFLAAYQYLDSFDTTRPFGPWLTRIVMNRGANLRRARARRETEPETDAVSPAPSALDDSTRREMRDVLTQAMATLNERQRMIVILFDVDGLTSTEIGEQLELAPGTVRWHLHEARRILRDALSGFIEDDA